MLKPLHNICLFALLMIGLVSCKKEQVNTLPDSNPQQYYFTIKDTAEYPDADYYINPMVFHFPQGVDTTIYYHLDNDGIADLKFTKWDTAYSGGGYAYAETMYDLTPDSTLNFSAKPFYASGLYPHALGDTLFGNNNIDWTNKNSFAIKSGDYVPPSESWLIYNWVSQVYKMVGFRKMINGNYKYGWIMIDTYNGTYGPSAIER